ncbi:MAG TPA: hypothetical protein VF950_05190 [Planctomycetota bacterium]
MAFKQNLPAVAILASAGAVVGLIVLTRPPDEDLLRQAAAAHVKTMDKARDFQVFGETVDVLHADGSVAHLAFAKRDGAWAFDRELSGDFAQRMRDPAMSRDILERLGRRLAQRFNADIKVSEGLQYGFRVHRDPAKGVAGEVAVSFAYPKTPDGKQMRGRYVETFLWKDGRWDSQGVGALFDSTGTR